MTAIEVLDDLSGKVSASSLAASKTGSSTARRGAPFPSIKTGSSTAREIDARMIQIDRAREAALLSHEELIRRSGVNRQNYFMLLGGKHRPAAKTLERLQRAVAQGKPSRPPQLIKSYHHLVTGLVARAQGLDPDKVRATDITVQKTNSAQWLAAARARMIATYITAVELEVENVELADAIGCSRQAIKKARDKIEDLRDQPTIDALIDAVSRELRG